MAPVVRLAIRERNSISSVPRHAKVCVRYILEGSVRRGGDRLRFTGQLIDATSGAHIWADRFEGNMGNVFALQARFTESVVAAIEPTLQLAEIARLRHKPPSNLDA